jgi:hypothetical protein
MLTPAQLATLKAVILANPTWAALPINSDTSYFIADELKKEANPAFIVWKTSVSVDEIMRNGMDWARVDNMTPGKARIWDWLGRLGSFDAGKINVRAGIDAAWVGTAADLAVRAAIYVHCKRPANALERIFANGSGSDASPGTMAVEGSLSYQEVDVARGM